MRPADTIEIIGKSKVQHGHFNNRAYVMRLDPEDIPGIIPRLGALAEKNGYTKIVIRVPYESKDPFLSAGYVPEADVPGFYNGTGTALFMGKYLVPGRAATCNPELTADVLATARAHYSAGYRAHLQRAYTLVEAGPDDAGMISSLYRETFESYPFPVFDPGFIKTTMEENVRYFCILHGGVIVAVGSCDTDTAHKNAEMTDFATDLGYRGQGLAGCLLEAMEEFLKRQGILLAYTIARATSYPMNVTFARAGYACAGTLANNTNICGTLESMNIWYKRLVTGA
ncbi:putative beta-lysine N-acetyltransferase [Methanoregula sp. UBA64]|jgi:beta-lysine N6-acetyltransferase|uniref:putative beta-lysine N-acetyltransferase n=1 Tax=Methanoregula sp. UBA64 TaxID=1915554 RepID=UPI0025F5A5AE|nr:putative beta-lysine N-acetyltransferase [Methanoregula sp. UBA64]